MVDKNICVSLVGETKEVKEKKKYGKKMCNFCKQTVHQIPRHLRDYHRFGKVQSRLYASAASGKYTWPDDVELQICYTLCPVVGCGICVKRIDAHLVSFHKFVRGSTEFKTYKETSKDKKFQKFVPRNAAIKTPTKKSASRHEYLENDTDGNVHEERMEKVGEEEREEREEVDEEEEMQEGEEEEDDDDDDNGESYVDVLHEKSSCVQQKPTLRPRERQSKVFCSNVDTEIDIVSENGKYECDANDHDDEDVDEVDDDVMEADYNPNDNSNDKDDDEYDYYDDPTRGYDCLTDWMKKDLGEFKESQEMFGISPHWKGQADQEVKKVSKILQIMGNDFSVQTVTHRLKLIQKDANDGWLSKFHASTIKNYFLALRKFLKWARLERKEWLPDVSYSIVVDKIGLITRNLNKQIMLRSTERRDESRKTAITDEQIRMYRHGERSVLARQMFQDYLMGRLEVECPLTKDTHTLLRNRLVMQILLSNATRAGPIVNLRVKDVERAQDNVFKGIHVMKVVNHKTNLAYGIAHLSLPKDIFTHLMFYVQNIRPTLHPGVEDVFVTFPGKSMNQSLLANAITKELADANCGREKLRTSATTIRKYVVSKTLDMDLGTEVEKGLAELMKHSDKMQKTYYNLSNRDKQMAKMSTFVLEQTFGMQMGECSDQGVLDNTSGCSTWYSDMQTSFCSAPSTKSSQTRRQLQFTGGMDDKSEKNVCVIDTPPPMDVDCEVKDEDAGESCCISSEESLCFPLSNSPLPVVWHSSFDVIPQSTCGVRPTVSESSPGTAAKTLPKPTKSPKLTEPTTNTGSLTGRCFSPKVNATEVVKESVGDESDGTTNLLGVDSIDFHKLNSVDGSEHSTVLFSHDDASNTTKYERSADSGTELRERSVSPRTADLLKRYSNTKHRKGRFNWPPSVRREIIKAFASELSSQHISIGRVQKVLKAKTHIHTMVTEATLSTDVKINAKKICDLVHSMYRYKRK